MSKLITGIVSSDKSDKTITVSVRTSKVHPLYKKSYKVSTKYMAHDEKNEAKIGDTVIIKESKPISAKKRFVLEKIVEKAQLTSKDLEVLKEETENQKNEEATK